MLLHMENSIWLTVMMICGDILRNFLRDGCLENGVSDVKNSDLFCLEGKEGKRKVMCSRKMASAALAQAAAAQTAPHGDNGHQEETQKKRNREKMRKISGKKSILGLKLQHL